MVGHHGAAAGTPRNPQARRVVGGDGRGLPLGLEQALCKPTPLLGLKYLSTQTSEPQKAAHRRHPCLNPINNRFSLLDSCLWKSLPSSRMSAYLPTRRELLRRLALASSCLPLLPYS